MAGVKAPKMPKAPATPVPKPAPAPAPAPPPPAPAQPPEQAGQGPPSPAPPTPLKSPLAAPSPIPQSPATSEEPKPIAAPTPEEVPNPKEEGRTEVTEDMLLPKSQRMKSPLNAPVAEPFAPPPGKFEQKPDTFDKIGDALDPEKIPAGARSVAGKVADTARTTAGNVGAKVRDAAGRVGEEFKEAGQAFVDTGHAALSGVRSFLGIPDPGNDAVANSARPEFGGANDQGPQPGKLVGWSKGGKVMPTPADLDQTEKFVRTQYENPADARKYIAELKSGLQKNGGAEENAPMIYALDRLDARLQHPPKVDNQPLDPAREVMQQQEHAASLRDWMGDKAEPEIEKTLQEIPDGAPNAEGRRKYLTGVLEHLQHEKAGVAVDTSPKGTTTKDPAAARAHLEAGGPVYLQTGKGAIPIKEIDKEGHPVDDSGTKWSIIGSAGQLFLGAMPKGEGKGAEAAPSTSGSSPEAASPGPSPEAAASPSAPAPMPTPDPENPSQMRTVEAGKPVIGPNTTTTFDALAESIRKLWDPKSSGEEKAKASNEFHTLLYKITPDVDVRRAISRALDSAQEHGDASPEAMQREIGNLTASKAVTAALAEYEQRAQSALDEQSSNILGTKEVTPEDMQFGGTGEARQQKQAGKFDPRQYAGRPFDPKQDVEDPSNLSPHHAAVVKTMNAGMDHLPPEQAKRFQNDNHAILARATPEAAEAMAIGLKNVVHHTDPQALNDALKGNNPALQAKVGDKTIAGTYRPINGEINVDGDTNGLHAQQIKGHELGHAIAEGIRRKNGDPAEMGGYIPAGWDDAHNADFANGKLTNYAKESPQESFAEACSAILSGQVPPDVFRKEFPAGAKVMEKYGILPKGAGATGPATRTTPAPQTPMTSPLAAGSSKEQLQLAQAGQVQTPRIGQEAATEPMESPLSQARSTSGAATEPMHAPVGKSEEPIPEEPPPYAPTPEELKHPMHARVTGVRGLGGGLTDTHLVTLENGKQGVWKPANNQPSLRESVPGGTYHRRETAASDIAGVLGLDDLVPKTVTRSIDEKGTQKGGHFGGQVGSVQEYFPKTSAGYDVTNPFDGPEDKAKAAAFDYLIGQTDRHPANWLLTDKPGLVNGVKKYFHADREGDKLKLIDNALSLPVKEKGKHLLNSDFIRHMANEPVPDVSAWADKWPQLEAVMKRNGIEKPAIELAKHRFDSLVQASGSGKFGDLPFADDKVRTHLKANAPGFRAFNVAKHFPKD